MRSRYQKIARRISNLLSIAFLLLSILLVVSPSSALQLLFVHNVRKDNNDGDYSSIERTLTVLFGSLLAAFSATTFLLNRNSSSMIIDPSITSEIETYNCRLALGAQIVVGFICVISTIQSTETEGESAGHVGAYPILIGGCLVMILSSTGLMASFCTFAISNNWREDMPTYSDQVEDIDDVPNMAAASSNFICCRIRFPALSYFYQRSQQRRSLLPLGNQGEETESHTNIDQNPLLENRSPTRQPNNRINGIRRILQLASPQKITLFFGCLVLLIRLPFSLSIPHLVSATIGSLSRNDYTSAKNYTLLIMILGTVDAVLDFWCVYLFGGAKQKMIKSLRIDTFKAILSQEMAFFDKVHTGELTSRLTSDCGEMAGDLTWFFRFSIEATVRITGISLYMLIRCPPLGCTALSIIPVVALVNKKYGNWLAKNATEVQTALAEANNVAQEALTCIRTVIAFATEDVEHKKYDDKIDNHFRLNMRQLYATGIYYMVISTFFINTCIQATLLFVGSILIQREHLTAEVLLAFMLYQGQLQEYTLQFFQSYTSLIKSSGAGEKVFALLDRCPNPPGTNFSKATNLPSEQVDETREIEEKVNKAMNIAHGIELSNIHFKYPLRPNQTILQNLNLTIPSGSTVALVGPSGCGKSTIVSLLERFYDPVLGQILVDGIDLRNLSIRDFRRRVGIVAQDPVLFSGTILSNILYGSPSMSRTEAIEAAKLANVDSFVKEFPLGYDTEVGEKGVQLSGGQKQRLAIARAMAKQPSLLLLDEATSALDQDSERVVQKAIDSLLHDRNQIAKSPKTKAMTTVVVAHRLQTVRNADWIVVMQPGVGVVESGNHDELIEKKNGYYRRMIKNSNSNGIFFEG